MKRLMNLNGGKNGKKHSKIVVACSIIENFSILNNFDCLISMEIEETEIALLKKKENYF